MTLTEKKFRMKGLMDNLTNCGGDLPTDEQAAAERTRRHLKGKTESHYYCTSLVNFWYRLFSKNLCH